MFGPIRQLDTNSKFYSARLPNRLKGSILPHVTVQCPVYKEGLNAVIAPTVRSLKKAISTYELQGGSANVRPRPRAQGALPPANMIVDIRE